MPTYILRDLNAEFWDRVKARAAREGHSLRGVILALLTLYADKGLPDEISKNWTRNPPER